MAKPEKFRNKYRIRWTDATGTRRWEFHDNYDDAAFALARHEVECEEVKRGLRPLRLPGKTFKDLCDYWMNEHAPSKATFKDQTTIVRRRLEPAFGRLKLTSLSPAHVTSFKKAYRHLDPKTVNNYLTVLISMLRVAKFDLGWLAVLPRIKKYPIRINEEDYNFLRSDEEVSRFLASARRANQMVYTLYATAVYTGMRQGEIAALTWSRIDFERRLITVSRSFKKTTKSNQVRYVPILNPLLPILREWRLRCPTQLVFPNRTGKMHRPSDRIFQERLQTVLDDAGFERLPPKPGQDRSRHYIVFHDLRHTFASHWMMNSGDLFKLQRILGHQSTEMTNRYSHLAPEAFAADYDRIPSANVEPAAVLAISGKR